mmetsp:Transcript_7742/g.19926  ORF Transcript_7742/g.19926 Transcript_7742/m.19926 type:complete len:219 (+) Transcript_7742:276-932(+)
MATVNVGDGVLGLIKRLAHPPMVVGEEPPVNHKLEGAVGERCDTLGSVNKDGKLRSIVPDSSSCVAREIVSRDWFSLIKLPRRAKIPLASEHLAAVRVGEQLSGGQDRGVKSRNDLLASGDNAPLVACERDVQAWGGAHIATIYALAEAARCDGHFLVAWQVVRWFWLAVGIAVFGGPPCNAAVGWIWVTKGVLRLRNWTNREFKRGMVIVFTEPNNL